jgi:hypothetical protein
LYCTQVLAWQAAGGGVLGVALGLGDAEERVAEGVGVPEATLPVHATPLNLIVAGAGFVPEYEPLKPKLTEALVATEPL